MIKRFYWLAAAANLILFSLFLTACAGDSTPTGAASQTVSQTSGKVTSLPSAAAESFATATPVVLNTSGAGSPSSKFTTASESGLGSTVAPIFGGSSSSSGSSTSVPSPTGTSQNPRYNKASLEAFNIKSISALGLDQKTIKRVERLLISSDPPLKEGQPGVIGGSALVASTWKLAPPLWWCEDSAANLDSVWKNLSFSLEVDDQSVDLSSFKTVDFSDGPFFCRAIDLGLGSVPTGVHKLLTTRRVTNTVQSPVNGAQLAPGNYIYQIALLSVAPNRAAIVKSSLSDFKLGSSTGSNPLYKQVAQDFAVFSDALEQFKPGTFKYTAAVFTDFQYGLVGGWCAKDKVTLEENWKKMVYNASVDGQSVDLSQVPQLDRQNGEGQACRLWDLSMTPPEGQHTIVIKLTFKADTNDGAGNYLAGDYISEFTLLSIKF